MSGQQILDWLKSNIVVVIFLLLIVGAFVVLPILSRNMQQSVDEIKDARARQDQQLTQLRQTQVALNDPTPGAPQIEQTTALINPATLGEFREYTEAREAEAEAIAGEAVSFNRKDRGVLVARLFPDPPFPHEEPSLLIEFSQKLREAYIALLEQIDAGQPPSLSDMRDALVRQDKQYRNQILSHESRDELTAEEMMTLRAQLSARRFGLARTAAEELSVYCSLSVINPPSWSEGQTKPTAIERFHWQWDYWIIEDLLHAIGEANASAENVLGSPVKRIVSIRMEGPQDRDSGSRRGNQWQAPGRPPVPGGGGSGVGGPPIPGGGGSGLSGPPIPGGGGGGLGGPPPLGGGGGDVGGGEPRPPQGSGGETGAQTAKPVDPAAEVKRDYPNSMTGRTTNPLYDVRVARVHLIVETAAIPRILDAIGTQNFMTIIGMELWPADPYTDLESGYVYGDAPTSEIVLDIETVWLRSWTAPFMPREVKIALGIPVEQTTSAKP